MIKQLSTKTVYQNKWMKVREDNVEFTNGSKGIFGVIEKADFAMVIPFENNGFYLVKQFRYPVSEEYWEFPQGSYEHDPGKDPLELAKAELQEETGLVAAKMKKIGYLYEAYGFSNQGFHIFFAEEFKKKEQDLEISEEGMETKFFTVEVFEQMVLNGKITDAPTISAYGLLKIHKLI